MASSRAGACPGAARRSKVATTVFPAWGVLAHPVALLDEALDPEQLRAPEPHLVDVRQQRLNISIHVAVDLGCDVEGDVALFDRHQKALFSLLQERTNRADIARRDTNLFRDLIAGVAPIGQAVDLLEQLHRLAVAPGNGDVYPTTAGGKLFTFVILMCGLGIVAVPAALVAAALSQVRQEKAEGESHQAGSAP